MSTAPDVTRGALRGMAHEARACLDAIDTMDARDSRGIAAVSARIAVLSAIVEAERAAARPSPRLTLLAAAVAELVARVRPN